MNNTSQYTNKAQQRLCRLIETLAGHERFGLPMSKIASLMDEPTGKTFRDLMNLEQIGWARQMGTGHWCLTGEVGLLAVKMSEGFDKAQEELDQKRKEYLGEE